MINAAIKESNKKATRFSALGCNSIFSGGAHNCCREKLKIAGVNLHPKLLGFLATTGNAYAKSASYHKKHPIKKQI